MSTVQKGRVTSASSRRRPRSGWMRFQIVMVNKPDDDERSAVPFKNKFCYSAPFEDDAVPGITV
jgi:hypothetical protein